MLVVAEVHILMIGHNLAEKNFNMNLEDIGASGSEDVGGS